MSGSTRRPKLGGKVVHLLLLALPCSFFPLFCFLLELLFFRYLVDGIVDGVTDHLVGYALRHLFVYEVVVLPLPITLFLFEFATFYPE